MWQFQETGLLFSHLYSKISGFIVKSLVSRVTNLHLTIELVSKLS